MEHPEHGSAPAPARRAVGGYELVRVLGSGGMGTVYEAIDADGRSVALKLLHPAFSTDDAARERLRREVATLHRVRGARVARVLDAEADSDEAFVVTELIDGESLDHSIRTHGPMDAEELCDLAEGLATALEQIHAVGVVHRDMKPGNVMLTDDGPVVIDFGISQVADDARLTQTGLVTGTPGYVDPQVLAGGVPDAAGDWWGWAAVLLFAATGRAPFGTGPLSAVLARVETGRADVDGLPPRLGQVLRRALHPDPTLRMPHGSVLRALSDVRDGRDLTQVVDVANPPVAAGPLPPSFAPGGDAAGDRDGVGRTRVMPAEPPPVAAGEPAEVPPWVSQQPETALAGPPVPAAQPQHPFPAEPPVPAPVPGPPAPADPQPGDPLADWPGWARPARSRPGITLAWWPAVVGLGMLWPGWALLTFGLVLVVLATVGSSARALRNRRLRRGVRRSDLAVTSLATPLHLLIAIAMLVPGAVVGVLGGGIVWGLLSPSGVTPLLMLLVMSVTTALAWWTPSSQTAREGGWAVLGVLAPTRGSAWVWVVVGLAVATATITAALLADPTPVWAPLPVPPVPR
ncbi:serine/threonine-protein kinase [Actinotalea caeni]|uniref:serine/threonine-protein kinase n=1 Tax=Actinotalea caeni TaxID=1348467 RepID=UPI0012E32C00|nr:serine/threonine-protein kinase [Actinotalea caeni]